MHGNDILHHFVRIVSWLPVIVQYVVGFIVDSTRLILRQKSPRSAKEISRKIALKVKHNTTINALNWTEKRHCCCSTRKAYLKWNIQWLHTIETHKETATYKV